MLSYAATSGLVRSAVGCCIPSVTGKRGGLAETAISSGLATLSQSRRTRMKGDMASARKG